MITNVLKVIAENVPHFEILQFMMQIIIHDMLGLFGFISGYNLSPWVYFEYRKNDHISKTKSVYFNILMHHSANHEFTFL